MKATVVFYLALVIAGCSPQNATEQAGKQWSSIESYRQAKAILDSSIVAMGGIEKIRAIDQVTLEYDGPRHMINQSRKPEGPWDKEPSIGKLHVDRKKDRIYTENASYYPGIGSYAGSVRLVGTE